MGLTVQDLFIYPVKSLGGIAVGEAVVEDQGLRWDRRWMIVDSDGVFLTQRTVPLMATIKTAVTDDGELTLSKEGDRITIPPNAYSSDQHTTVTVWDSVVPALPVSEAADEWLSGHLSQPCSLVFMPETTRRAIDPAYAIGGETVSFADGFPILIANTASLSDLNGRMDASVPMDRFRPNIVIESDQPFSEDGFGTFRLGSAVLEGVKPCSRCSVTTVDQSSGQLSGKEPLKTLATFRKAGGKVNFGENLVVRSTGRIRIGDSVEPLAPRQAFPRSNEVSA